MVASGLLLLGLVALLAGADLIIRGGSRLAARLGIPPIIIGLTIVSIGTSAPELAIGIEAASRGNGSLAVGNIAGTNNVNLLLILGLSALLCPLALEMRVLRFDLPIMIAAASALLALGWDGTLTRTEGALLIVAGIVYSAALTGWVRRESRPVRQGYSEQYGSAGQQGSAALIRTLAILVAGIVIVVLGSGWLVDGAVAIATMLDVPDAVVGLTVVAIGTSSPELVTTVVGTLKKDRSIAIGNLLGSSIYNILLVLGITCVVPATGIRVDPELIRIDIPMMILATLVCVPAFFTARTVSRAEGGAFVVAYLAYLAYLLVVRT